MYHDFTNTSHEGWKYCYTGAELLPFAKKKYDKLTAEEKTLRDQMADRLKQMSQSVTDEDSNRMKKRIESLASMREQLQVFIHEFNRESKQGKEREFNLSLGDVVFFEMV